MGKVIGYVHHHIAQRPDGDNADSNCRYSFEDWSHGPDDNVCLLTSDGRLLNAALPLDIHMAAYRPSTPQRLLRGASRASC